MCQRQAIEAEARRDYERFHDLAWRTIQIGPARQPDLMVLLARAQALSGRPHDALVMIQRLADMGVAVDTSAAEFDRTRALPDWPAVASAMARRGAAHPPVDTARAAPRVPAPATPKVATAPMVATAPVVAAAPSAGRAVVAPRPTARPMPSQPAARSVAAEFIAPRLIAGGLAYDTVSRRFVIGDAGDRKLFVVGVDGVTPTDMVRAESAGFEDVAAVAIDEARGDLWVAGAAGTVHRLQLVSGRPLRTYRGGPAVAAARIVDLAVGPAGTVVALDAAGTRLLTLGRGTTELRSTMTLDVSGVTSLVVEDEGTVLVAHAAGIVRADLRTHTTTAVAAAEGIDLGGIEQLRAHRRAWIGVQRTAADRSQVVRWNVTDGRRVTGATVVDSEGPSLAHRAFLSVSGDEVYYLTAPASPAIGNSLPTIVRRLILR